jgi:hypothetical protein
MAAHVRNHRPRRVILETPARDSRKNMGTDDAGVRAVSRRLSPFDQLIAR